MINGIIYIYIFQINICVYFIGTLPVKIHEISTQDKAQIIIRIIRIPAHRLFELSKCFTQDRLRDLSMAQWSRICCQCRRLKRHSFDFCIGKIPWSSKWQPTPIFLPGEFHEQRSLVGYSPQSYKESDMTQRLNNNSSNIPLYIYKPHLYPFLCQWTCRLLSCLCYCKYAAINIGVCVSF